MSEAAPIIRVEGVSVTLGGRKILDRVDLTIRKGEVFVLLGPSGCGKTTLLRCLIGLLVPTEGKIFVGDTDIVPLDEGALDLVRRRMGVSFQAGALFNSMTVLENVELPLIENTKLLPAEIRAIARMKLEMVGLLDAAGRMPSEISGGMRKRAAIARAMALDPEILFFDEPSSGLDPLTAAEIDELIRTINKAFGVTVFAVTHDIASAFTIGHRTAMMRQGRLLAVAAPEEMRRSADPAVVNFLDRKLETGPHASGIEKYLVNEK